MLFSIAFLLNRALNKLIRIRLFACLSCPVDVAEPRSVTGSDTGARILAREEIVAACDDPSLDLTHDFVNRALALGHVCVGVLRDGGIASYCWMSGGRTALIDGGFVLPSERSRYVYKAFTAERHRGARLFGICLQETARLAAQSDCDELITIIEYGNLRSLRAFKRFGFRTFGYAVAKGLPAKRFVASKGCSLHGLSFSRIQPSANLG